MQGKGARPRTATCASVCPRWGGAGRPERAHRGTAVAATGGIPHECEATEGEEEGKGVLEVRVLTRDACRAAGGRRSSGRPEFGEDRRRRAEDGVGRKRAISSRPVLPARRRRRTS